MTADDLISTAEAARRLGVSSRRVRALIAEGRLDAIRVGRISLIRASSVAAFTSHPRGWPRGRKRKPPRPEDS